MSLPHGRSKYANDRCRCQECRADWSRYIIARRVQRFADSALNDGIAADATTHNRWTFSNWGCRCDVCRTDFNTYQRERAARRRQREATA